MPGNRNVLYLIIGALIVAVGALGYNLYQVKKEPEGLQINVGPNGLKEDMVDCVSRVARRPRAVAACFARACGAGFARAGHPGSAVGPAHPRRRRIVSGWADQGSDGVTDDDEWNTPYAQMHSAHGNEEAVAQ
jgi:hypothetical protein